MSRLLFIGVIFCFLSANSRLCAQDVHFSQRLVQNREKNPSFLQHFEGKWQAYSAYRQQWSTIGEPFVTSTAQVVRQVKKYSKPYQFFIGGAFTTDKSGDVNLNVNQVGIQVGGQYLSPFGTFEVGISNQFVGKSLNLNGVTFPEQYDRNTGHFNENLASGESLSSQRISYMNWNAGIAFFRQISELWSLRIGMSVSNISQPKESFYNQENRKNRGYGSQFIGVYKLNSVTLLEPYVSYYYALKASETILGSAILFKTEKWGKVNALKPFLYFRTGIARTTDALILGSRMNLETLDFGISYDLNISKLEVASEYEGGFELSLFYTIDYPKLKERRVPCVRY